MEIELRMRTKTGIYKKKDVTLGKLSLRKSIMSCNGKGASVYVLYIPYACSHHLDDKVHILLEELHNSHSLFAKVTLRDRQLYMSNAYAWLPVVNELCRYMSPDC